MGGGTSKIIEEWREGSEWYRVWSNGLIEQGGVANVSDGLSAVSLKKPFSDTQYHVSATVYEKELGSAVIGVKYSVTRTKKTTEFTLKVTWAANGTGIIESGKLTWMAIGF